MEIRARLSPGGSFTHSHGKSSLGRRRRRRRRGAFVGGRGAGRIIIICDYLLVGRSARRVCVCRLERSVVFVSWLLLRVVAEKSSESALSLSGTDRTGSVLSASGPPAHFSGNFRRWRLNFAVVTRVRISCDLNLNANLKCSLINFYCTGWMEGLRLPMDYQK